MDNSSSIIVENVSFESEGYKLLGRIYRPNAAGKFPAVALCHGYPGDNKNFDLAEELAFNSIISLVFYYRGAWGSEGVYSLRAMEPSTRDAVEFLLSKPFVDLGRLGLIAHSMGAVPASKRLSVDSRLKAGVFTSPAADISGSISNEMLEKFVPLLMSMGKGKLNALNENMLKSEFPWVAKNSNPADNIRSVKAPILVVVGSKDTMTPPDMCKILYENANQLKHWILIDGADHDFTEHRIPLINSILTWLKNYL